MGTIINDRPDFYKNYIAALKDQYVDVLISCGKSVDIASFGTLPENIRMEPYVDQLDVLSLADLFLTHCGMNSVSESLYMATPMILFPQTGEQEAVARRAYEMGAGERLTDDSSESIRTLVTKMLGNPAYAQAARKCCDDLRACPGTAGAAEFIENAPHKFDATDPLKKLSQITLLIGVIYRVIIAAIVIACGIAGIKYVWILAVIVGFLGTPIDNWVSRINYEKYFASSKKQGAV